MIDRFFGDPNVLLRLRSGPLGPYVDGVCRLLVEQDYAEYSVRLRLRLLGVLSQWLGRHGLVVEDLDEQTIAKFLAEPAQARTWVRRSRAVLRSLLDHLRGSGILSAPKVEQQDTPWTGVERAFSRYLIEQRGVLQTTVGRYLYPVRHFLGELFGTGPLLLNELSTADVTRFILRSSRLKGVRSGLGGLRCFFRFLRLSGEIAIDLAGAVPRCAHWRLSGLPKSLPAEKIERLLETCNRSLPLGLRDYAILLLLARLGLRAAEVWALRLEDLDWNAGELTIRGKGHRQDRLPMLKDVGTALAAYLRNGRPGCATRRVFVGVRAPHRGLAGSSTVSAVVQRALQHAGLCAPSRGAHMLRHSLATEMLRRHATLGEIGQILRHRQPSTTEIYAKVDFDALRTLAQPWPGGHP
jgi:site-specific recombinase XerD